MSVTVDANVLVYSVNEAAEEFAPTSELIRRLGQGPDIVYLFWPAVMGFLRIVTHPSVLPRPLSAAQAEATIERLLVRPHIRAPGEGEGFWKLYRASADRARGNDVPDAHLAALMRGHGVSRIYTRDRGFRRFEGLTVLDPLAGKSFG